jgi:hypothetical protein|tara:strand:+ start:80 stop:832 length:753 start_codon:yes stop_codon:yes gene_type:complete
MKNNYFEILAGVDCADKIEKKGNFNYLSWPFAIQQVAIKHPDWAYEIKRFDGMPYLKTELGYFVEVSVTIDGIERSEIMPVLDNRNKPVAVPTTFEINTSHKRCLVKAIALHGLGLYIYAGEDLPSEEFREEFSEKEKKQYHQLVSEVNDFGLYDFWLSLPEEKQNALYNSFDEGTKVAMKKQADTLVRSAVNSIIELVAATDLAVENGDDQAINEAIEDVASYKLIKQMFFKKLGNETQEYIKQLLKQG